MEICLEEDFSQIMPDDEVMHLHCLRCHKIRCKQNEPCPMKSCLHCGIRLHNCKMNDHVQNICSQVPSPCPNAAYGCPIELRRHLLASHLTNCPASIVHCPFVRNRQFLNAAAKKIFKKIAKGQCPELKSDANEEEMLVPDIAYARIDQALLQTFFRTPREWRRRFSPSAISLDGLAEMSQSLGQVAANQEDSSDEEKRATEKRQKAIREPFSGCRLCRLDPGSQHLHELGSMRKAPTADKEGENQREKKLTSEKEQNSFGFLPNFFQKRGIFLQPDIAFTSIVTNEQFLRVNYPVFGCSARFVRRDQFGAHYKMHLALDELQPASFFARCPNWQYGCSFWTDSKRPNKGGRLRFNPFLAACCYEPIPAVQSTYPNFHGLLLDHLSVHFFTLLAAHLDDASIRALSSTCHRLKNLLTKLLNQRMTVELIWKKQTHPEENNNKNEDGIRKGEIRSKFVETGFRKTFAPVQGESPQLLVIPQGQLIDHLQECPHQIKPNDLGTERIDLRHIFNEINPLNELKFAHLVSNSQFT